MIGDVPGVYVSYRQGGTLIEYSDEDPQIRVDFEKALKNTGVKSLMPEFQYNNAR